MHHSPPIHTTEPPPIHRQRTTSAQLRTNEYTFTATHTHALHYGDNAQTTASLSDARCCTYHAFQIVGHVSAETLCLVVTLEDERVVRMQEKI
jgi:hypothetical protein